MGTVFEFELNYVLTLQDCLNKVNQFRVFAKYKCMKGVPSTPSVRIEIFKHAMHFVVMVALRKTNELRKGRNRVHS